MTARRPGLLLTLAALAWLASLPRRLARWLSRPGPGQLAAVTVLFLALSAEEIRHTADAASAAVVVFSRTMRARRREDAEDVDGDGRPGVSLTDAEPWTLRPRDARADAPKGLPRPRTRALARDRAPVPAECAPYVAPYANAAP